MVSVGRVTQYLRIAGIQSLTVIPLDSNCYGNEVILE